VTSDLVTALIVTLLFIFGLLIGSFLNVVVYRVPAGISLLRESRCPQCDTSVRAWQNVPVLSWVALRGKCASCGAPISPRYPVVEALTAVAFALVGWWFLTTDHVGATGLVLGITIAGYLYFAAISIVLTLIDLDRRRLPNAIVLPSYVVGIILLAAAALLGGDAAAIVRALIGMAAMYALYWLLRLVRPRGMGGGDVKLAGVVGLYLGFLGWGALATGAFAAFVLGGVFGITLILARRAGLKSAIPFGPWMLLGAWVGVFAGETLGHWYIGLYASS